MAELCKRSSGRVRSEYFTEKADLEAKRKKGFCMICQSPLIRGDKDSGRKYHKDCFEKWFAKFKPPMLWTEFRERALVRDNYTCRACGDRPDDLNLIVDHIKPIALGGEEFDMENLQTLCEKCNKKKTFYDMKMIAIARRSSNDQKNLLGNSCVWVNNLQKEHNRKIQGI